MAYGEFVWKSEKPQGSSGKCFQLEKRKNAAYLNQVQKKNLCNCQDSHSRFCVYVNQVSTTIEIHFVLPGPPLPSSPSQICKIQISSHCLEDFINNSTKLINLPIQTCSLWPQLAKRVYCPHGLEGEPSSWGKFLVFVAHYGQYLVLSTVLGL